MVLAAALLIAGGARAETLVADLSRHLVRITTGFTGSDVLLFGAVEGRGDVVVVVRGPQGRAIVRRKSPIAGVWVNRERMMFTGVPAYYAVAASGPLEDIVPRTVAERHQIGTDYLRLKTDARPGPRVAAFRAALIRNQQRRELYASTVGKVSFLGQRLFRTTVHFPANVPTGTYTVQVFLLNAGRIVSAQTTPLAIHKAGLEAELFEFAHRYPAYYGIIAIIVALMAGWGAGLVFRRA